MTVEALFDTNVLVHAYTVSDVRKHRIAVELVSQIWSGGRGVTSLHNLCEFIVVVTRKVTHPIPLQDAELIFLDILHSSHWRVLPHNQETVKRAIDLGKFHKVPFWDALIASCMIENNLTTVFTENEKDFKRVPNLSIINPFKKV